MAELVTFGETALRLSPENAERLETAPDLRVRASGTESNVAVAASRLGADATWLSKLPDTALGHRVDAELRQHGIDTDIVWTDDGRQGLRFSELSNPPREGRTLNDRAGTAVESVTPGELSMDRVQQADAVFVGASTFALSENLAETAKALLRAGSGSGVAAMDLDYHSDIWSVEEARETLADAFDPVDVLVANEEQARTIFNRTGKPREMAHTIASKHDFEIVAITRSEYGALVCHNNVIHEQDTADTDLVDPDGQHEAFTGAFLERVLEGASADEALAYGVASAALTRTIPGAMTTITRPEVEAVVDDITSGR